MIKRIKKHLTFNTLRRVSFIVLLGMVLFYAFGPLNPADLKKLDITSSGPYFVGSEVNYVTSFCRHAPSNVRTDVVRSLVPIDDPEQIAVPISNDSTANNSRCRDDLPRKFTIPSSVQPGACYFLKSQLLYYYPLRPTAIERTLTTTDQICIQRETAQQRIDRLEKEIDNAEEEAAASLQTSSSEIAATEAAPSSTGRQTQTSPGSVQTPDSQQGSGSNGGGSSETPPVNPPPGGETASPPGIIESIPILGPILGPILRPITSAL